MRTLCKLGAAADRHPMRSLLVIVFSIFAFMVIFTAAVNFLVVLRPCGTSEQVTLRFQNFTCKYERPT
jgi:hypothetical protein